MRLVGVFAGRLEQRKAGGFGIEEANQFGHGGFPVGKTKAPVGAWWCCGMGLGHIGQGGDDPVAVIHGGFAF